MESIWSQSGVYGLNLESMWSPHGVHVESIWSQYGVHMEPMWSLCGVYVESMESMWSPYGVHMELWGSVNYSKMQRKTLTEQMKELILEYECSHKA